MLRDFRSLVGDLLSLFGRHSVLPESTLSPCLDLGDALHRLDRRGHELSVVTDRNVATLLEFECRVLQAQKGGLVSTGLRRTTMVWGLTIVISLPAAFLNALVHLTFLGLRFILKFLWHLDRRKQQIKIHEQDSESAQRLTWMCRNGTSWRHFGRTSCLQAMKSKVKRVQQSLAESEAAIRRLTMTRIHRGGAKVARSHTHLGRKFEMR